MFAQLRLAYKMKLMMVAFGDEILQDHRTITIEFNTNVLKNLGDHIGHIGHIGHIDSLRKHYIIML